MTTLSPAGPRTIYGIERMVAGPLGDAASPVRDHGRVSRRRTVPQTEVPDTSVESTLQRVLDDLCVVLGFCLGPAENARLRSNPPSGVDADFQVTFCKRKLLYQATFSSGDFTVRAGTRTVHPDDRVAAGDDGEVVAEQRR